MSKKEIPLVDLSAVIKNRLINRLGNDLVDIEEDDWKTIADSLVDNKEVTAETLWPGEPNGPA